MYIYFTYFFTSESKCQFVDILHWYEVCHPEIPLFNFLLICLDLEQHTFSEKIILIDKIPPFLHCLNLYMYMYAVSTGMFTTIVRKETFDWASSTVKTYLGYLWFTFFLI